MSERDSFWTKLSAVATFLMLIFAIVALSFSIIASNTANNLTQEALKLQSMTSNYNTTIVPYVVYGTLGTININSSSTTASCIGFLNLSLIVITPHASMLNFSGPESITIYRVNRTTTNGIPVLDPQSYYSNDVYVFPHIMQNETFPQALAPGFQNYLGFVQPGVTQMNFSFPINGNLYFNPSLTETTYYYGFITTVAKFNVKMVFLDLQTNQTQEMNFPGDVDIFLNVNL